MKKPYRLPLTTAVLFTLFLIASPAARGATNCCPGCTSSNFISFTNIVVPGFNFLANNLCQSNNTVGVLLPNVPFGTELLKWDPVSQSYDPVLTMDQSSGGWIFNSNGNNASGVPLDPGEGYVLENNTGTNFTVVERGCLPTCPLPCLPTNGCVLVGRYGLGSAMWTNLSSCPPICGTRVNIWDPITQGFTPYDYTTSWMPQDPVVASGQSAFVCLMPCPCPCPATNNPPAPPNDLCANAIPISLGITYGYTSSATPSPAGSFVSAPCGQSINSADVWYTFTTNCPGGLVTLDTCPDPCGGKPHFDTVLSVYTGTCPLLSQVACNNNNFNNYCTNAPQSSKVTFHAAPCVTYYIRVAGFQGATGCFALNATFQATTLSPPSNDSCGANVPLIQCNQTRTFQNCAATAGPPNTSGCPFDKDIWFRYIPACAGMVSAATCGSFFDTTLAVYHGSCSNLVLDGCNNDATAGPCAGSSQSYLTFLATANTTYFIRVGSTNGSACTGKLTVIGPNPAPATCPPTNCSIHYQRVFQVVGNSTGNAWSWCLSAPCCFNISGTVSAGTVPANSPASAIVAAMVASINSVCPNTATQLTGSNTNKFKIRVCTCANCPVPFIFRVGAGGAACDDMCVVDSAIIVSATGPCIFNPLISELPLSGQDCNGNGEDDTLDILDGTSLDVDANGVPDECPIVLQVAYDALADEVQVSWVATDAVLEQSADVTGPWDEVLGATSPYSITPPAGRQFFRLRLP